ncbi:afadin- and alpha-actinin-binding protein [Platysternon megacephalum]|uniref:Afadin-and alpha-actinin-binding protein n=1 Tax=Platysternon megacephalum TaxID=55544 RepID=A0A4D9EL35_9SAUR|nr:afadin- and alpha-actinin-binding protein [Platysternon megacephalum]
MFPAAQMLFALSSFLRLTMGFDIGLSTKCVAIPMEMGMCHSIGYSEMRLPNLMGHTSMAEVIPKSAEWQHFVETGCHPHARTFLCSLFAPVCLDTFIHPCRSMCVAVRDSCAPLLLCHGLSWPDSLDCDRFPADEDMCLASLSKEYKHIHKELPKPICQTCPAVEEFFTQKRVLDVFCANNFAVKVKLSKKRTVSGDQEYNIECQVEFINQGLLLPYDTRNMIQQWLLMNENCTQRMTQTYRPMVYLIVGNIEEAMASGTALIYDDEMTSYKLLWDDSECDIEVPERLLSSYEQLKHYHLVERCIHVPVREGTEEEIMLVHSSEYLEVVKSTQTMNEEELRRVSENYDAVYFHPNTYRCAKLAVGATLQLVDSVMSGKVRNGMALVRPPGHHSQRNAANGFCVFNNVAIAAQYAKRRYGLQRILIVDWDVHHGQGIQYVFEEDPSVLYYSWHRYEHQQFWPLLRESDYDVVGQGKGKGFNLNVPWNKVAMGNSDYLAAFFHVLLPVAFEFVPELILVSSGYDSGIGDPEGQMNATPECFAHLTHFLMQLANGRLCAVLEGGYHLKSLSESVCMTVKTLLGDPPAQISGEMAPCLSAVESIQNVRAAHKPYWKCLMYEEATPLHDLSTKSQQMMAAELIQTSTHPTAKQAVGTTNSAEAIKTDRFLESHMKKILFPVPPVKTAAAIVSKADAHLLPISVQVEMEMNAQELKTLVRLALFMWLST